MTSPYDKCKQNAIPNQSQSIYTSSVGEKGRLSGKGGNGGGSRVPHVEQMSISLSKTNE